MEPRHLGLSRLSRAAEGRRGRGQPLKGTRRARSAAPFVVVTDLDGCFLDARTYRPGPAASALRALRRASVPVFFATSKTRAEVVDLGRRLGLRAPAIVESGGGIWIPRGSLPPPPGARRVPGGVVCPVGPPYARIRRAIVAWRRSTGSVARGFGDASVREIARRTGLPLRQARLARRREFDEPLWLGEGEPRSRLATLRAFARARRLVVSRGGRFFHLHGRIDKGRAVRRLLALAKRGIGPAAVVALGDGPHDAPLLRLADLAFVVPRPDGTPDPVLVRRAPRAALAPAPGPAGWAAVVRALLRRARA